MNILIDNLKWRRQVQVSKLILVVLEIKRMSSISSVFRLIFLFAHLVDVGKIEHGGLHDLVDQMSADFGHFSSPRDQDHIEAFQKSNETHDPECGDLFDFGVVVRDFA